MDTTVEFTPVMLVMIAVLGGILQGFKKFLDSKTTATTSLQAVKPLLPLISVLLGVAGAYFTKQPNFVVTGIVIGGAASFGFDIYKGVSPTILIICAILFVTCFSGCMPIPRPINMGPVLEAQVELAATTTAEFNRRCEAGDPNACSTGLRLSSETLQIIVDGLHDELEP